MAALVRDAAAPLTPAWQPIETAPKGDVQRLMLHFAAGHDIGIGYWDAYYAPGGRGYRPGLSAWCMESNEGMPTQHEPTHWQPLPLPPAPAPEET